MLPVHLVGCVLVGISMFIFGSIEIHQHGLLRSGEFIRVPPIPPPIVQGAIIAQTKKHGKS